MDAYAESNPFPRNARRALEWKLRNENERLKFSLVQEYTDPKTGEFAGFIFQGEPAEKTPVEKTPAKGISALGRLFLVKPNPIPGAEWDISPLEEVDSSS